MNDIDQVDPVFEPDETLFRCKVTRPRPEGDDGGPRTRIKTQKMQGCVEAFTVNGELAGRLFFHVGADVLESVKMCTQPEYRGQGCVAEMVKAVRREYPGFRMRSSPATPTQAGRDTLQALLAKGLYDELRIDLNAEVEEPETGRCD